MKVISYSLYGSELIYTIGCIKNAKLRIELFPDWDMWVYYNETVPKHIIKELKSLGVKLIKNNSDNGYINSMWRFLPMNESNIEYYICRDCDSRISERDVIAVNEWIESGKDFHIIRDHPIGHWWPMNAGMWGSKGNSIYNFKDVISNYLKNNFRYYDKSIDQHFLKDVVYPLTLNRCLVHDEYYNYENCAKSINHDRESNNFAFIGEAIQENDEPAGDQRTPIIKIYNRK
jgi:hypothetical protein